MNVIFNIKEVNMSVVIEEIKANLAESDSEYLATLAELSKFKADNAALVAERDALKLDVAALHEQIASIQIGATDEDLNALLSMSLTLKNRVDTPVVVDEPVVEAPVVEVPVEAPIDGAVLDQSGAEDPNAPTVE